MYFCLVKNICPRVSVKNIQVYTHASDVFFVDTKNLSNLEQKVCLLYSYQNEFSLSQQFFFNTALLPVKKLDPPPLRNDVIRTPLVRTSPCVKFSKHNISHCTLLYHKITDQLFQEGQIFVVILDDINFIQEEDLCIKIQKILNLQKIYALDFCFYIGWLKNHYLKSQGDLFGDMLITQPP